MKDDSCIVHVQFILGDYEIDNTGIYLVMSSMPDQPMVNVFNIACMWQFMTLGISPVKLCCIQYYRMCCAVMWSRSQLGTRLVSTWFITALSPSLIPPSTPAVRGEGSARTQSWGRV